MELARLDKRLLDCLKKHGGVLMVEDVEELDYCRAILPVYAHAGLLERYGKDVYICPGVPVDNMFYLRRRVPAAIFSHESALYLHGLIRRRPTSYVVTIPSATKLPRGLAVECTGYYAVPALYELGVTEAKTSQGHTVRVYDVERSICDLLRRRRMPDTACKLSTIMKRYFAGSEKNHERLIAYGERLGVMKKLLPYLKS